MGGHSPSGNVRRSTALNAAVYGAFALHLLQLAALYAAFGPNLTGDSAGYVDLAKNLLDSGSYGHFCEGFFNPEAARMPGYPAFLAFVFAVFGDSFWPVVFFQGGLFLASVWLMWRAVSDAFGERTGIIFLGLSSAYPFIAFSSVQVLTETLCVFGISIGAYLFRNGSAVSSPAGFLILGLLTYFRPNLVLLPIVVGVFAAVFSRKPHIRYLLVPALATAAVMVPWTVRNYVVFGTVSPLPVVKSIGVQLFLGTWQSRLSTESLIHFGATGEFTQEAVDAGMKDQVAAIRERIAQSGTAGAGPIQLSILGNCDTVEHKNAIDAEMRNAAIGNIMEFPGPYIADIVMKTGRMWFSSYALRRFPGVVRIVLTIQGVAMAVLGFVGILIAIRSRKTAAVGTMAALVLYFPLTLLLFHTEARYTIPGRLALLAFAAFAIATALGMARGAEESGSRGADLT